MKKKEFYGLSFFMCILAFVFMIVSIWNADWTLSLKGYYIVCIGWIFTSVFNVVRIIRDKEEGLPVGGEAVFLGWAALFGSTLIMIYSAWNTDWELHLKGYYWLGTAFVIYSSYALADQMRDRQEATRNGEFVEKPKLKDESKDEFFKKNNNENK